MLTFNSLLPKRVKKSVSQTPFELLTSLQEKTGVKYFHTGNLDPMARGLMLFIPVKYRFLEKKFKSFSKVYKFSIISGFDTDSRDLLGLITNYDVAKKKLNPSKILEDFRSKYVSQQPPRISRKNLTKNRIKNFHSSGMLNDLPSRPVKVYNLKFLGHREISKEDLFKYVEDSLTSLNKNFRQDVILARYAELKEELPDTYLIYDFRIKVSGGFYVRALVRDISKKYKIPLTTFDINRIKIGPFGVPRS